MSYPRQRSHATKNTILPGKPSCFGSQLSFCDFHFFHLSYRLHQAFKNNCNNCVVNAAEGRNTGDKLLGTATMAIPSKVGSQLWLLTVKEVVCRYFLCNVQKRRVCTHFWHPVVLFDNLEVASTGRKMLCSSYSQGDGSRSCDAMQTAVLAVCQSCCFSIDAQLFGVSVCPATISGRTSQQFGTSCPDWCPSYLASRIKNVNLYPAGTSVLFRPPN